ARYGGIGVVVTIPNSAGLANIGAITRAVSPRLCSAIEIAIARRLTFLPRFLSSALPSTKHSPKFPGPCSIFTISFRSDIAHLHSGFQGLPFANPLQTHGFRSLFYRAFSRSNWFAY